MDSVSDSPSMWVSVAAAPEAERYNALLWLRNQIAAPEFVEEHSQEISDLLLHSVDQSVSRRCQLVRRNILRQCIQYDQFSKEFVVALIKASTGCHSVLRAKMLLIWSGDTLQCIGGKESMQKAVHRLIGVQEKLMTHMLAMNRLHSKRCYRIVRAVLLARPELLDMYLEICESTGARATIHERLMRLSGAPSLVSTLWMAVLDCNRRRITREKVEQTRGRLLNLFIERFMSGQKTVPAQHDLGCFSDVLAASTLNEVTGIVVPAAVKMMKRSPEIAFQVSIFAFQCFNVDLSSKSDEIMPLILQQARHAKESVRMLTQSMAEVVASKTKDPAVIVEYAKGTCSALQSQGAAKVKSPQERVSLAIVLGKFSNVGPGAKVDEELALEICTDLISLIMSEIIDDVKVRLLDSLSQWLVIAAAIPDSFLDMCQKCLKDKEPVRKSLLSMLSSTSDLNICMKKVEPLSAELLAIVSEGMKKVSIRWEAVLAFDTLVSMAGTQAAVATKMEESRLWETIYKDDNALLNWEIMRGLDIPDTLKYVSLAMKLLLLKPDTRQGLVAPCATIVTLASLHFSSDIRRKALSGLREIADMRNWKIMRALVQGIQKWISDAGSITYFLSGDAASELLDQNLTIHERYLSSLLACFSSLEGSSLPSDLAVQAAVLAHHRMISGGRGRPNSWKCILASLPGLAKAFESNVNDTLASLFSDRHVLADDKEIQIASLLAVQAVMQIAHRTLFEPSMEIVTNHLDTLTHDKLSAKQLRIYGTPYGRLSNEDDGGMIPAELMDELLADKANVSPPTFHPTLEFATNCLEDSLTEELCARPRSKTDKPKTDPAAIARRKQMAQEAQIRLEVVKIREHLSIWLRCLGQIAMGIGILIEDKIYEVAQPCMRLMTSPLVGTSAAMECLDNILMSISNPIGRRHFIFTAAMHLIVCEEAKTSPNYTFLAGNHHIQASASTLILATDGTPPSNDIEAVRGHTKLSGSLYEFFFPLLRAILRSNKPTSLHKSILDLIDLHLDSPKSFMSFSEEFDILFHVLEMNPALRQSVQHILTRVCEMHMCSDTAVIENALAGVLLSEHLSRRSLLIAVQDAFATCGPISTLTPRATSLLWIACHDVDEENAKIGLAIWDRIGCSMESGMVDSILEYCIVEPEGVRKSSASALGAMVEKLGASDPSLAGKILDILTKRTYSREGAIFARLGVADCLISISESLSQKDVLLSIDFLLSTGFLDGDSNVRTRMTSAGVSVIGAMEDESAESLLPIFEKYLERKTAGGGLTEQDYDHVRLGAVVCIGATAQHLDPNNPKVISIVTTLVEVLRTPSESVQRSVSDRLAPLLKSLAGSNKDFVEGMVSDLLKTCLGGESYADRRGAAYGLSGAVKGLGLSSLKAYGIMEALKAGVESKKDHVAREGSLIAFECLSGKLGRLFEPYVIQIIPMLLAALGDGKVEVREAADAASRVIMSQLTAQGVKLVLPSLLKGAEEKQWRAKQGSIQLLGSMAYCAPKQLSSCLPTIVPVLGEALADPHPKVSGSAKEALDEVGAVIRNPEVSKLVPVLMSALSDPNKNNKAALNSLLTTIFVNTIDSPSLALIIPVVHRGLRDRSGDIKKRAARIVGNLCALVNDPKDMSPYLPSLMPELQGALIDPLPEVRGAAAKALGALTSGMANLEASSAADITPWLLRTMKSETSSVERSGAAQGLAEILAVKGASLLDEILPIVFDDCSSRSAAAREGSMTLFRYLPYCMPEEFQRFLPRMLPCILGGLADESEGVREASFAAGSVAVELYAKSALPLVLPAVESGAEDCNWRIRQSSIELLGELLFKVVGTSGRIQQDLHDDGEGISVEAHGQAIIDVLGTEKRNEVLARLYLARADVAYTVRTAALHVWKTVVTNTPKTLVEILPILMERVILGLSEEDEDRQASAGQCLGELVRKLGDRVLAKIVPILIEGSHSDNPSTRIGSCNGMREVASNASKTQLSEHMADLITQIQQLLCDEDDQVRSAAGGVLEVMFKTGGGSAAESVIPSLLKGLHGGEEKSAKALEGLRVVLSVQPQLLSAMVPKLVEQPLSITDVTAIGALAEVAGKSIHPFLSKLMPPLLKIMHHEDALSEKARPALLSIATAVEEEGLHLFISQIQRGFDTPETVYGSCECLRLFAKNTELDFQEHIGSLLGSTVPILADGSSERNLKASWEAISAVTSTIPKDMAPSYVRALKDSFMSAKDKAQRMVAKKEPGTDMLLDGTLPGLCLPKALSPFVTIYLQGVLQGSSVDIREMAAQGLGELVDMTDETTLKPFVIQITGPLIRIVGDRLPSQTKIAILHTMGILVDKAGASLRPFVPQLQTTFVKCLPDSTRSVRMEGAANLGRLSRMAPRLDQLVTDLASNSHKASIDMSKEAYISAIGSILRESDSRLKPETMDAVSEAITEAAKSFIDADDENAIPVTAMALGEYAKACSSLEFRTLMDYDSFGPLGKRGVNIGSRLCTALVAAEVATLAGSRISEQGIISPFLDTVIALSKDVSVDVRMAAAVAGGRTVVSELQSSAQQSPSLSKLMAIFIAHLGSDQHVEVQKQCLAVLRRIACENESALEPFFIDLIPSIVVMTKESTGSTKLAAERVLAKVLRVEDGDETSAKYIARADIGTTAKQALTEPYLRRLVRISDTDVDDLADYAI